MFKFRTYSFIVMKAGGIWHRVEWNDDRDVQTRLWKELKKAGFRVAVESGIYP